MIALLNYVHVLIVIVAILVMILFRNNNKVLIATPFVTVAVLVAYFVISNSYIDNGTVPRLSNPSFEDKPVVIEDRLKKPVLDEQQREQRLDELLDWRDQIKDTETKPEQEEQK
jgi:multisubunit Na+/H+ antiporter MnhC subunit